MKYLVYDLEILKAIPPTDGNLIEGIEYCKGWDDIPNMGISVLGIYIGWEDRYCVFMDHCDTVFNLFSSADVLVGFNSVKFDNQVIINTWGEEWKGALFNDSAINFDILRETWKEIGANPDIFNVATHGGYSLNSMSGMNLLESKRGYGGIAGVLWQQGSYDKVINYCLDDVAKTTKLFNRIRRDGYLLNPKKENSIIRYYKVMEFLAEKDPC